MKKILIKLLMLIGIVSLLITCNSTISLGEEITLHYYLYDSEHSIFANEGTSELNTSWNDEYKWIPGIQNMVSYIQRKDIKVIANDNSKDDIMQARAVTRYLATYFQNQTDEMKKEFVNNDINSWVKENSDACSTKLQAAYDIKTNRTTSPTINDSYIKLFQYNLSQIQEYANKYKDDKNNENDGYLFNDKLSSSEITTIKELWKYKNSSKCPNTTKTRKDIYVQKEDSYENMMAYDIDQINVYTALWGAPVQKGGDGYTEKIKGIKNEWDSMLKNGKHTDFFMNHSYRDSKGVLHFNPTELVKDKNGNVIGEKTVYYEGNYNKKTDTVDNAIKENQEAREDVKNEKGIESNSDYDTMGKDDEHDPDLDVGTTYHQPQNNTDVVGGGIQDVVSDANNLVNGKKAVNYIDSTNLQDFSNSIYNILLSVGVVVAVIVGMILGIKLMLAPVGERAEAKKMLVPYAVGCAVVFGAFGIWKIVVTILQNLD